MDGWIDRQVHNSRFQPSFGPSVDSLCHPKFTTNNLSYRFPIFETSATALCGTTGMILLKFTHGRSGEKSFGPLSTERRDSKKKLGAPAIMRSCWVKACWVNAWPKRISTESRMLEGHARQKFPILNETECVYHW